MIHCPDIYLGFPCLESITTPPPPQQALYKVCIHFKHLDSGLCSLEGCQEQSAGNGSFRKRGKRQGDRRGGPIPTSNNVRKSMKRQLAGLQGYLILKPKVSEGGLNSFHSAFWNSSPTRLLQGLVRANPKRGYQPPGGSWSTPRANFQATHISSSGGNRNFGG